MGIAMKTTVLFLVFTASLALAQATQATTQPAAAVQAQRTIAQLRADNARLVAEVARLRRPGPNGVTLGLRPTFAAQALEAFKHASFAASDGAGGVQSAGWSTEEKQRVLKEAQAMDQKVWEYIGAHPELPIGLAAALCDGKPEIGMTAEQVRLIGDYRQSGRDANGEMGTFAPWSPYGQVMGEQALHEYTLTLSGGRVVLIGNPPDQAR